MKLLFDQNISHLLLRSLLRIYPLSSHVRGIGLERASDDAVWSFARDQGFTLVSKDADFHQRSLLYGFPPKLIWLRVGNCPTESIETLLLQSRDDIELFCKDHEHAFLILSHSQ